MLHKKKMRDRVVLAFYRRILRRETSERNWIFGDVLLRESKTSL